MMEEFGMPSILARREQARFLFVVTGVLWSVLALSTARLSGQSEPLTVEKVVTRLPSLIGTAPTRPVWSPDSSRLTFLWNDEGMPFRDVWMVEAAGDWPTQLTDMRRDGASPAADAGPDANPVATLARTLAARTDGGVSEVIWTPDGRALLFTFRGDIFRVEIGGAEPERLTGPSGGTSHLALSPGGRHLSFLRSGDLWLWDQETNERVQATEVGVPPIGTVPGGRYFRPDVEFGTYIWDAGKPTYRWSPNARFIALHYEDRRGMRKVPFSYYLGDETVPNVLRRGYPGDFDEIRAIAVYSVAEGRFRFVPLADPTYRRFNHFEWSPDGNRLLVDQSSEDGNDRWIYLVNAETLSVRELWYDRAERRLYPNYTSSWRSDGESIFFVADLDERYRLYELSLEGGQPKPRTGASWDVVSASGQSVSLSPERMELVLVSNQKSPYERQVYRVPEAGGAPQQITTMAGTHEPFVSPDGKKLAVLHSSDTSPTELYLLRTEGGDKERRITHSPLDAFNHYPWIEPRYVTVESRIDDYTLHGRLLVPPGLAPGKRYPVIVGPVYSNSVRNRWAGSRGTLQQYLALEGDYIGLQVDIRGSTGYGRSFREAFHSDTGGGDIEDLASVVAFLKTLPYVDPDRIGIWGSSYGGTLTVFSLFRKPGLFRAGVAAAPAVDARFFGTDDIALMGLPRTAPDVYRRVSAIHLGEDLEDHLLIIHGMQDNIVPFKTSVVLAEKLMLLGKNFDFVFAPGATHGWSQREHDAIFLTRKLVEHFDRYLGRGPSASKPKDGDSLDGAR